MNVPLAVLSVEDSESDSALIDRCLRAAEFDVFLERVETAEQMRAALQSRPWDIVLSDFGLPSFNSGTALAMTRETDIDLPFIIVSGHIGEEAAVALMKAGAHDYVMKGNLTRLAPAVKRELDQARGRRERRSTEHALQKQSQVLKTLLENFPGGVSVLDSSLHFVAWNESLLRMMDLPDTLFADGAMSLEDIYRYNIKRGEYGDVDPDAYLRELNERARRREPHHFERIRPNGTVVEIRGEPIASGGFVTTYTDITDRRQIEEQLRRQSVLLSAVLENMPQGLSVFDQDLRLQVWNDGFVKLLEYPPELVFKGATFESLLRFMASRGEYGADDIEELIESRLVLTRKFEAHRFERTRPNGRTHLVQGEPLFFEGKLTGFITTYTDITDFKQAERGLHEANLSLERRVEERSAELRRVQDNLLRSEKLAAMGSLVTGVAHQLNTPIGNSLLVASTLSQKIADLTGKLEGGGIRRSDLSTFIADVDDAASVMVNSLNNAARLVSSFKQVAVDQASLRRRRYNLAQVCHEAIAPLMTNIQRSGHTLELEVPQSIHMESYPGPLGQVIDNFVSNAILHAFDGKIGGSMRLTATQPAVDRVEIRFSDNGIGIAEENLKRIFDPFFTTKLGHGGSGLGLNVVYNIVTTLLGGQITTFSVVDSGTTFMLDLPAVAPLASV